MKGSIAIFICSLIFSSSFAGPKKCTGKFCNIKISKELKVVTESSNDLILKHETLNQYIHIIADENYDYLEYNGEIMGQFSNKFTYKITQKDGYIDITMQKKNGKFLHEYMIIEHDDQVEIAEVMP